MEKRILTICLNPTIQKTLVFDGFKNDEVNRAALSLTDASGKGINVTRVLSQIGADAVHLTHAGGPNRQWFLDMCAADGLDVRWVDSSSPVRICTTVIDSRAGTTTELVEEAMPVAGDTEARFLALFDSLLGGFDIVTISGTKAAGYSPAIIPAMVESASNSGALTILDVKGEDLLASLPFRPTIIKPNLAEFLSTFPAPFLEVTVKDEKHLRSHVRRHAIELKEKFGTEIVITRGSKAVWFSGRDGLEDMEAASIQALNTTGSGDAFTAGLAHALACGKVLREGVTEGIRLGGLNASALRVGSIFF